MSTQPTRLTWRKGRTRSGQMRLAPNHKLCRGEDEIATVQEARPGFWFWYGAGANTARTPTDLATAKRDAKAYILSKEATP
jgi:hypothetical protein